MEITIIEKVLNSVVKEKYPDMVDTISVDNERDKRYISDTSKRLYTVKVYLTLYHYYEYGRGKLNDEIEDIREMVQDSMKMLGINDNIRFYFW